MDSLYAYEANASMDSLVERTDADPNARELKLYERRYHDFHEGIKQRKVSNQTHVSATDPDATLVSRKGYYRKLCLKTHYTIDADTRIITDCYAATGSKHECSVLPGRIDYHLMDLNFCPQEWIADRGYGRGPTYGHLRAHNIRHYIPLHYYNLGQGRFTPRDFLYDRRHDRYRCPRGHFLYPYQKVEVNSVRRYRMLGGHCRHCPLKQQCLPASQQYRSRFVYRNLYQDEIDQVRRRQETAYFKSKLTERMWKIEGLFAEAKQYHGLRRAKYRGIKKFQIQCYMTAITQNIKRIIRLILKYLDEFYHYKVNNLFKEIIKYLLKLRVSLAHSIYSVA